MSKQGQTTAAETNMACVSATPPTYSMNCCHGTTIFWLRISPSHLLIGVDSRAVVHCSAPGHPRTYELLHSDEDNKFIKIFGSVFATLAGDSGRCKSMFAYVNERMKKEQRNYTLYEIAEIATHFFQNHPSDPNHNVVTLVYLCSWISSTKEYVVMSVGDKIKTALRVEEKFFGTGCESISGLDRLEELCQRRAFTRPKAKDADVLVEELLKASILDPYTGGSVKVYSLKDNADTCVHEGSLAQKLYNHNEFYEDEILKTEHMFVIVRENATNILSPQDLLAYLNTSFDPKIERSDISWLCYSDNAKFLAYLVKLSSKDCCDDWFDAYPVSTGHFRTARFTNSDNSKCNYAVAHARREVLDIFRVMESFEDLTAKNDVDAAVLK
ncbi:hypothetical protein CASFOL_016555 [Castilleja foliolosa]|uniref:Uncharacterized protein n=1 Tax=Castilleja foliolosa TaxID=1961234 RepID=A0ABD3D8Y0_9LAMI